MNTRQSWRLPAGGIALVLLSLFFGVSVASATPPSDDTELDAEVADILGATENDSLFAATALLESLGVLGAQSPLASIVADSEISEDGALILTYYSEAPEVDDLLERIAEAAANSSIAIRAVPVGSDPVALGEMARRLSVGTETDLRSLGVSEISFVRADTATGTLIVGTDDVTIQRRGIASFEGYPVRFEAGGEVQTQSRDWDSAPWSGGVALRNNASIGSAACTAGFNWSKWGTNERMGSTAEHCYSSASGSIRYNHGTAVGTRYYYNVARDTFLMKSSGGIGRFNPNVFVGGTTTTTIRNVVGSMAMPPVNGAVALSGARSGLHTAKILSNNSYANGVGPLTVTDGKFCMGGDSGGPWLATNNSGNVIAYGQHYGAFANSSTGAILNCLFVPVTPISAALSASILTK